MPVPVPKLICPKCSGRSWLEETGDDIWQRCLCGLHKLVFTRLESGMTVTCVEPVQQNSLPRRGTKLAKCLGCLAGLEVGSTADVAARMKQSTSETASQLTVLMAKGLVSRREEKKGTKGGSLWELSPDAKTALRV